jgi:2-polyprenyl-3-methyl-5-hydroxy-6-metoxy-1,4-benzoquinol methylase
VTGSASASTAPGAGVYGRLVESHGLGGSHRKLLEEVAGGTRVLDVGCASGYIAALLTQRGCTVVGFERDPMAAELAAAHCSRVIVGDLESAEDRAALPGGFDYVLMGDILEHLADPWSALSFLRGLLAPGGVAILSLPNVAAWPVRLGLLRGAFDYTETGLLDRTHLRFFTRRSAHELVERAGFEIERERFTHLERRPGPLRRALPLPMNLVDRALVRLLPGFFAQQFLLRLRPRA